MYTFTALTALLSLSAIGVSALPSDLEARKDGAQTREVHPDNKWTISKVYVGCGNKPSDGTNFCSYEFDIVGKETSDLPGFSAHCYQHTSPRDVVFHQCVLSGGWSPTKDNRSVKSVYAAGQLFPDNSQQSKLTLQLTWDLKDSATTGTTYVWQASQTADYKFFSAAVIKELDLVPTFFQALAFS